MKIITGRLILRTLRKSDAKDIRINANNVKITKWMSSFKHASSMRLANLYVKKCIDNLKKKPIKTYNFGICLKSDNKVIGMINLHEVDKFQGSTYIGFWLGEKYWRKGYISEALYAIINFVFDKLKLRRIHIHAFSDNKPSNALIKKIGFRYEGTSKQEVKDKTTGKIHDNNHYGMLRKDRPSK